MPNIFFSFFQNVDEEDDQLGRNDGRRNAGGSRRLQSRSGQTGKSSSRSQIRFVCENVSDFEIIWIKLYI